MDLCAFRPFITIERPSPARFFTSSGTVGDYGRDELSSRIRWPGRLGNSEATLEFPSSFATKPSEAAGPSVPMPALRRKS